MRYAEVQIVLNPVGVDRIELVSASGDEESQKVAIKIYQKMAMEIHRVTKQARKILQGEHIEDHQLEGTI